jgi:hypothetical protein
LLLGGFAQKVKFDSNFQGADVELSNPITFKGKNRENV